MLVYSVKLYWDRTATWSIKSFPLKGMRQILYSCLMASATSNIAKVKTDFEYRTGFCNRVMTAQIKYFKIS